jgi:hypothetical protein
LVAFEGGVAVAEMQQGAASLQAENREHLGELQALAWQLGIEQQVAFLPSLDDSLVWMFVWGSGVQLLQTELGVEQPVASLPSIRASVTGGPG